ncbi:hypothetical protein METBIDRAFT_25987, partial [Metschnikowia bicuspidata var. bicuspidata NRRL YB-4993]
TAGTTVVTVDVTVTDYTTYCPASTVVTVTTCSNDQCAPTTVTVSEATTLTVTGECVVESTLTTAASSTLGSNFSTVSEFSSAFITQASSTLVTQISSSLESTTIGLSNSSSITTYEDGAGKAAIGAAGLVGVVAFLI